MARKGSWRVPEDDMLLKNALIEGHTYQEIADEIGVSKFTVQYHAKRLGLSSTSGKGGLVSSTIPLKDICKSASNQRVEDDAIPMCAVTKTVVTMGGIGTMSTYILDTGTKSVTIEKDKLGIEVSFKELGNFIEELKGVQKKVAEMSTTLEVF